MEEARPPATIPARTPSPAEPVSAVVRKPKQAPMSRHPSMPRLMRPARSVISSP